jgi:hypothetical protein
MWWQKWRDTLMVILREEKGDKAACVPTNDKSSFAILLLYCSSLLFISHDSYQSLIESR